MRKARALVVLAAAAVSVAACAQLFGIEEATPIADPTDGSADAAGDSTADRRPLDGPEQPTVVTGTDNVLAFGLAGDLPQVRFFLQSTVASGKMSGWEAGAETPFIDPSFIIDDGDGLGSVIWGRWAGGTTKGAFLTLPRTRKLPPSGGLHYALGRIPRGETPSTGTAPFRFLGGTHVTQEDGLVKGETINGTAAVEFKGAGTRIGFELTLSIGGANVTVSTPNGANDTPFPAVGIERGYLLRELPHSLQNDGISASSCGTTIGCFATVSGFFAGDAYDRLAIVVEVRMVNGEPDGGSDGVYTAVAVFRR